MGRRRIVWIAALTPLVLLLTTVAAWAIDTGAAGGEVLRNVELAGVDIGGLGSDELLERVETLDAELSDRAVRIETPEVVYQTTAEEIGLTVDIVATAEAALDEGRTAVLPARPVQWVAGFVRARTAPVHFAVDVEVARNELRRLEGGALVSPVEPTIQSVDGAPFRAVAGRPGTGIDPETLATALAAAADDVPLEDAVRVQIRQTALDPRLPDSAAEAAATRANELTAEPIAVTAGETTVDLAPETLRTLAVAHETDDGIDVALDAEAVLARLETDFADLRAEPADARITLEGGVPVVIPGQIGIRCCEPEAADAVVEAFDDGLDAVTVDLVEVEPEFTTADAEALGIVEEVGRPAEFGPTTNHACCQNRVTNIHRIADIVRGAIIRPGETFSINDFVGQRTREKGFVADGVIYNGVLTQDVGGGVSQFATTLFNAALFAGLEFGEYQSHSLYISRYPRGHEATISFPHPDLQIVNSTDYGVMIWPEYTDTSLTVRLFSTDHIDVAIGDPSPRPQGNCTRWTTPRTRTYEDGSTQDDSVFAVYRPAEGVNC